MTEPNRQSEENEERIIEIEIERLRPFKEHPFQVKDDKEMFLLQESIEKYGILNPLIVRPVPDGYYEIISGHRRRLNRKLAIEGILLTMVDFRTNYARDIASRVHTTYGSQIEVFENVIPMSVKAAETSAEGKSFCLQTEE